MVCIVLQLAATGSRSVSPTPAAARQVDVVNFLLEAGMDIEATEEAGATALYLAAENGQLPASWKCWNRDFGLFSNGSILAREESTGEHLYILFSFFPANSRWCKLWLKRELIKILRMKLVLQHYILLLSMAMLMWFSIPENWGKLWVCGWGFLKLFPWQNSIMMC